jgi:hypothetical protein
MLNDEIAEMYHYGSVTVLHGDREIFQENMIRLLEKSLVYRKAWFIRATTAITRKQRIVRNDPEYSSLTPTQVALMQWIQEGHPP